MTAFNFQDYANGTALNAIDAAWQNGGSVSWPTVQNSALHFSGWGESHFFYAAGSASFNNVSRATIEAAPYGENGLCVLSTASAAGYLLKTRAPADGSVLETFRLERNGNTIAHNFGGTLDIAGDTPHEVMLVCFGNAGSVTLQLWLNGAMIDSIADTPPQAGWPGLWVIAPAHGPDQFDVGRWSSAMVDYTDIGAFKGAVPSVSASLTTDIPLSVNASAETPSSAALTTGISLSGHNQIQTTSTADLWTKTGGLAAMLSPVPSVSANVATDIQLSADNEASTSTSVELGADIALATSESDALVVRMADGDDISIAVPDWLTTDVLGVPVRQESGLVVYLQRLIRDRLTQASGSLDAQLLLEAVIEAKTSAYGDLDVLKLLQADTGALPGVFADLATWSDPGIIDPVNPTAIVDQACAELLSNMPMAIAEQSHAQLTFSGHRAQLSRHGSGVARVLH